MELPPHKLWIAEASIRPFGLVDRNLSATPCNLSVGEAVMRNNNSTLVLDCKQRRRSGWTASRLKKWEAHDTKAWYISQDSFGHLATDEKRTQRTQPHLLVQTQIVKQQKITRRITFVKACMARQNKRGAGATQPVHHSAPCRCLWDPRHFKEPHTHTHTSTGVTGRFQSRQEPTRSVVPARLALRTIAGT